MWGKHSSLEPISDLEDVNGRVPLGVSAVRDGMCEGPDKLSTGGNPGYRKYGQGMRMQWPVAASCLGSGFPPNVVDNNINMIFRRTYNKERVCAVPETKAQTRVCCE